MSFYVQEVTLVGTWSRKNTYPSDIYATRRSLRRYGPQRCIVGDFHTWRVPVDSSGLWREGNFKFVVRMNGSYSPTCNKPIRRAFQLLKWLVADYTCNPPVMVLDKDRCCVRSYWCENRRRP